jgi:translation initiation factor IF-2
MNERTTKRVHEIAREQGLPSASVLRALKRAGITAKSASASVDVAEALHAIFPNRYPKPLPSGADLVRTAGATAPAPAPARPPVAESVRPGASAATRPAPAVRLARVAAPSTPPAARLGSQSVPLESGASAGTAPASELTNRPHLRLVAPASVSPEPTPTEPDRPSDPKPVAPSSETASATRTFDAARSGSTGRGGARALGRRRRVVIDASAGLQGRKRRAPGSADMPAGAAAASRVRAGELPPVEVRSGARVRELSEALGIPVATIMTSLLRLGEAVAITQSLSDEAIELVAAELGREVRIVPARQELGIGATPVDTPEDLVARAPVVTVMGHVDHGKTTLLDAIRKTEVAAGEAGGITQHIGAYQVRHSGREITFLDTPGHEAFTAMRARGAGLTDVAVIVVAADDGVMPQTLEAIDHVRAADVPFIVAITKIDAADANPDRVRQELAALGVVPAAWGGEHEFVEVSSIRRIGLDDLLETLLLVADAVAEPRANPVAAASGTVIESRLDPARGPACTLLVQRGTLRVGDVLVAGSISGRVRAMRDFAGRGLAEAGPSVPVEVFGIDGVPDAGERFQVLDSERTARRLAATHASRMREDESIDRRPASLEDLLALVRERDVKDLNVVVKADVHGSAEALREALAKVEQTEVRLRVIRAGVGAVSESDVTLAAASHAIIIAFNVRPRPEARSLAKREGVEIRTYRVIYQAIDDIRASLTGMLPPQIVEEQVGLLEVRATFRASRIGTIAGCHVTEGLVRRGASIRLVRDGTVVHEGTIASLRRFEDDVREVAQGFECGLVIRNYNDVKDGDLVEVYERREVARPAGRAEPRLHAVAA